MNSTDDWIELQSKTEVEEEYSMQLSTANPESSKNKWELFGLDDHLKASAMSGLIDKFTGASNYLNDKTRSSSQVSRILVIRTITVRQRLNLLNPVDFEVVKSNATSSTHAVVAVTYGLEAYCVFAQKLDDKESREDAEDNLSYLVTKFIKHISEKHDWVNFEDHLSKKEQLRLRKHIKCSLYSDLQTKTVRECSTVDAYKHCLKVISEMQRKTGEEKSKAVPISISLCPLKYLIGTTRGARSLVQYRDINPDLMTRCSRLWTEFERVNGEAETLRAAIKDEHSQTSLHQFIEAITKFQDIFKKELKIAVVNARETADSDDGVIQMIVDIAKKHQLFKPKRLKRWLKYKRAELEMAEYMNGLEGITVLSSKREVEDELRALDRESYALVMWVSPLDGKTSEILDGMTDYVENYTKLAISSLKDDQFQDELPWHMENRKLKQVQEKIRKFSHYVKNNNQLKDQIFFFVAFGEIGNKFGCHYSVYEGDIVLKDNLDELPGPPINLRFQFTSLESSVSVSWDYGELGYPYHFLVMYRLRGMSDESWNQIKTSKPGETQIIINNQSVMEVCVAAETCIGRSEFSEILVTASASASAFDESNSSFHVFDRSTHTSDSSERVRA